MTASVEFSEWGRAIIWLAQWSWYEGASSGFCAFAAPDKAVAYAKGQAVGFIDLDTVEPPGVNDHPYWSAEWAKGFSKVFRIEAQN